MKHWFLFAILILIFGCKKESKPKVVPKKPEITLAPVYFKNNGIKIDTLFLLKFNSKALFNLYQSFHFETVWQSAQKRNLLLDVVKKSEEEGLNPIDFNLGKLYYFEKNYDKLSNKNKILYDILLTKTFRKYISQLTNGRLNPKALYKNWDLKPNKMIANALLIRSIKTDSMATLLENAKPNHLVYQQLKNALLLIDVYPNDTLKNIEFKEKIVLNDTNTSIVWVKRKLMYWKDLVAKDSLNTIYDKTTFRAVIHFQKRHGIIADGIIGQSTIAALNYSKTQRKQQIIANLERWKWFPNDGGNQYLIINIPDYKLTYVKKNDTLATQKVIVGSEKRRTPVLSSMLRAAVFNPTWTVPPTILNEDVIPATTKDFGYLKSKNITVYDNKGKEVGASKWQLANAKKYRYVQSPGSFNSLGMVKLIFPNRFSVYLHDTNHRGFFDKTNRSLSSGCVRVQNILKLTESLLDDSDNYSEEKIAAILKTAKSKSIPINQKIEIHLLYWTAWSEGNTLIFRNDIYNLDADLYTKLRN